MAYIPDDISQIPDNHPGYVPASEDSRKRLTILPIFYLSRQGWLGYAQVLSCPSDASLFNDGQEIPQHP